MLDRLIFASIQGGIALGGVWLICLIARRLPAAVKVWLWRLAMLKMLVALIFPAPTLAVLPAAEKAETTLLAKVAPPAEPQYLSEEFTITTADPTTLTTEIRQPEPAKIELDTAASTAVTSMAAPANPSGGPSPWLLAWTIGGAALALLAFVGLERARRAIRNTRLVDDSPAIDTANSAANQARLRKAPALRAFEHTGSPFVTGLLRPFVAVPQSLIRNLDELRLALLHEFAHLKRGDLPWAFFMTATRALFWFHPLAWIAEREHRVQSEIACDAFVVQSSGNRRGYALALVRLAILGAGDTRAAATLGAVGSRRALHRRLSEMSKPLSRRLNFRDALAIALPVAILLVPIHLAARAPQSPNNDPGVPLIVPAISPSELDDSTLPELEQMGAKSVKDAKADLSHQLLAFKAMQDGKLKNLTPEQRAKVKAELKKAIEQLTKALNEELPRALAEAEKELRNAKGDEAEALTPELRKQIEESIRTGMESARRALKELTLEKMQLDKEGGVIVVPGESIDIDIAPQIAKELSGKAHDMVLKLKMTKDKDGNVRVEHMDEKTLKELMKLKEMHLDGLKDLPLMIQGMNLDELKGLPMKFKEMNLDQLKGMKFKALELDKLKGMEMKFKEMKSEDLQKLMKEKGMKFEHFEGQPLMIKELQGEKFKELEKLHMGQLGEWKVITKDLAKLQQDQIGEWKVAGDAVQKWMLQAPKDGKWTTTYAPAFRLLNSKDMAPSVLQRYYNVQGKPLTPAQKKKLKDIDKKIQELIKQRQKLSPGSSLFAPTTVTAPAFSYQLFNAAPAAPAKALPPHATTPAQPASAPPATVPASAPAKPGNAPPPPADDES